MAFSAADLASIESAIIELITGARVVSITYGDGRQVRYSEIDLPKLKELRSVVSMETGTTITRGYARNVKRATL